MRRFHKAIKILLGKVSQNPQAHQLTIKDNLLHSLSSLKHLRGNTALIINGPIDPPLIPILYENLKHLGQVECLDLILITGGGEYYCSPQNYRFIACILKTY